MAIEVVSALVGILVVAAMLLIGRAGRDKTVKPFLATEMRQAGYAVVATGATCVTVLLLFNAIAHLAS
ncbi:MAG: hypothetical protein K0S00_3086 [Xanthobacteraceae bacterium]|jgi:hypothetical protein|nr:hypothetical protein [Xanthobacteraceae bacterium]